MCLCTWNCTVSCMAPRWTGMWGALDTKPPSGPNTAQEKSRRSFILVDMEVLCRTRPICSVFEEPESISALIDNNIDSPLYTDQISHYTLFIHSKLFSVPSNLRCSWSDGRRWTTGWCWVQFLRHTAFPYRHQYTRHHPLSDEPHTPAPRESCWQKKKYYY